ncbi:MAG TPA: VCBS repeat-containing protein [Micropepsaceae bacterium]|nr:VCBS repeat-containing protein [Micropepsaceae bacterium]
MNGASSNPGSSTGTTSPAASPVTGTANSGLTINVTYDASVSSAPVGFTTAITQVVQYFETHFSDPVTIIIAVGYGEVNNQRLSGGALGESLTYLEQFDYSTVRNALIADATTSADSSAVSSLGSTNPNGGNYWVTTAEGKALGLIGASNQIDGYVGFSNAAGIFDYTNSDGVSAGTYDFYGVVAHEFSEIMGRMLLTGVSLGNTSNSYAAYDLFHYSGSGVRNFSASTPGYFSIDGGATPLNTFNTISSGDAGDWRGDTIDAYNAFARSGVVLPISNADVTALDVIGWDATTSSSPPSQTGPSWNVLWQNNSGQAAIWQMDGANFVGGSLAGGNPGSSWQAKAPADFNADGTDDILWQGTDGTPAIWFMNGNTVVAGGVAGFNPGSAWKIIASGDFNGDGKAEILWQNTDGTPAIWLMNGTSILSGAALPDWGTAWHVIASGDFNGDGKADILLQNDNGQAAMWLMNGTSVVAQAIVGSNPGTAWHAVAAADFNGDGKADILWQNANGTPAIWFMNGTTETSGGVAGFNPGSSWRIAGAADVNGDGKADIIWQNSDGTPAVWFMNGTTLLSGAAFSNPGSSWHLLGVGT